MKNNFPIGIFDSGLGGLTVFNQIKKRLPKEKFIYFGDTIHLPYGDKSPKTIIKYSKEISKFLFNKKIKLLVVGCNTASAVALKEISKLSDIPIIDVIKPCVERAVLETNNKLIGIIGTETTISSQAYQKQINKKEKNITVYTKACPLFVPIIEEGLLTHPILEETIKLYLSQLKKTKLDTLILGCTHYPIIKSIIKKEIGPQINIIDSSIVTAEYIQSYLKENKLLSTSKIKSEDDFYITDISKKFIKISEMFLNMQLVNIQHINIAK